MGRTSAGMGTIRNKYRGLIRKTQGRRQFVIPRRRRNDV